MTSDMFKRDSKMSILMRVLIIITYVNSFKWLKYSPTITSKLLSLSSTPSSLSFDGKGTLLLPLIRSKSALDAIEAIKLLAEKRDIQLTHAEKEKIPQLMIYFLNKLEKDEIEKEKNDILYRRKNILSPYLLADCVWSAGTLQLSKTNNNQLDSDLNIRGKVYSNSSDLIPQQWNNDIKKLNNINDFFLSELATQIISSLYLQREAIRGRDIAKVMIGLSRMEVHWENLSPEKLSSVLYSTMGDLNGTYIYVCI